MKLLVLILPLLLQACGTDHQVNGGTTNTVEVKVTIDSPVCDDVRFTPKQKLRCIELLTTLEVDAKAEIESAGITDDMLDDILNTN